MKDKLYSAAYNLHVDVAYAKTAYDNACKEQNYNNWYSDEQWNEFQYKLADLKPTQSRILQALMITMFGLLQMPTTNFLLCTTR